MFNKNDVLLGLQILTDYDDNAIIINNYTFSSNLRNMPKAFPKDAYLFDSDGNFALSNSNVNDVIGVKGWESGSSSIVVTYFLAAKFVLK